MKMKVLAVKINTTGFDLLKDTIFDLGLVLYDVDKKYPIDTFSASFSTPLPVVDINNPYTLSTNDLDLYSSPTDKAVFVFTKLLSECDYVISCNGREYERSFLNRWCNKFNCTMERKLWIDLRYDVNYPKTCTHKSLCYLEAFHGFVNTFRGRCVFDCMSIIRIAEVYGIHSLYENAKSPLVTLSAVGDFGYYDERKKELNEKGFWWNKEYNKYCTVVKECFLTEGVLKSFGFEVDLVNVEEVLEI